VSDRGAYRRRDRRWRPSAAQTRILDALAHGLSNAEIAVRLGLSPETVKWHISELLAATGETDREHLVQWWNSQQQHRRLSKLIWLPVPIVLLAGLVVALASSDEWRHQESQSLRAPPASTPAPEKPTSTPWLSPTPIPAEVLNACPPPFETAGTQTVRATDLAKEGLVSLGQLVDHGTCTLSIVNRPDRSFVRTPLSARIDGYEIWGMAPFKTFQERNVVIRGVNLTIEFTSAGAEYSGPGAEFDFEATDRDSLPHRIALDSTGTVWVSLTPIAQSTVLEEWTGEVIDTSTLTRLGRLEPAGRPGNYASPTFYFSSCSRYLDPHAACEVSYRPYHATIAPVGGTLRCLSAAELAPISNGAIYGEMELDAGAFKLRFREVYTSGGPPRTWPTCDTRQVQAGDVIGSHYHYVITALRPDGTPLDAVVALDSTLYVGEITREFHCPCTSGN
jgi:DNA-binding CsgD family transcriptional regulator